MVSNLYGRLNLILVRANARSLLLRDISSRREIHVHVVPKHNFVVNLFISYMYHQWYTIQQCNHEKKIYGDAVGGAAALSSTVLVPVA